MRAPIRFTLDGAHVETQRSNDAGYTLDAVTLLVDGIEVRALRTRPATPEEAARWAAERGAR